jgi:hypothetical protein
MRIVKIIGGLLVAFMGTVWMLQGFGATYVPTSFMTKAPEWIFIGIATAAVGVYLVVLGIRDRG